jgi:hypothetical protein
LYPFHLFYNDETLPPFPLYHDSRFAAGRYAPEYLQTITASYAPSHNHHYRLPTLFTLFHDEILLFYDETLLFTHGRTGIYTTHHDGSISSPFTPYNDEMDYHLPSPLLPFTLLHNGNLLFQHKYLLPFHLFNVAISMPGYTQTMSPMTVLELLWHFGNHQHAVFLHDAYSPAFSPDQLADPFEADTRRPITTNTFHALPPFVILPTTIPTCNSISMTFHREIPVTTFAELRACIDNPCDDIHDAILVTLWPNAWTF